MVCKERTEIKRIVENIWEGKYSIEADLSVSPSRFTNFEDQSHEY